MAKNKEAAAQGSSAKGEATASKPDNQGQAPSTAPPTTLARVAHETEVAAKAEAKILKELEIKRAEVAKKRAQLEAELHKEREAGARQYRLERVIPVIVQQRKNKPVRIRGRVVVPCLTPVMVNRTELRKLQGASRMGRIQIIVGELQNPGKVQDLGDKPEAKGEAS